MGVLGAGQAQALVVNVNGQLYNVTTFTGTYAANTSKFNTAANGGTMPWWRNNFQAQQFSVAVNTQLGVVSSCPFPFGGTCGPMFADSVVLSQFVQGLSWRTINGSPQQNVNALTANTYFYAMADLVQPVPGPLPAFGAAAAFGFSRKLRKRIKHSSNDVSSI
jgi:hypothetical protein